LAFWITDDGTYNKTGVIICTKNFSFAECLLLISVFVNSVIYSELIIDPKLTLNLLQFYRLFLQIRNIVCLISFLKEMLYKLVWFQ